MQFSLRKLLLAIAFLACAIWGAVSALRAPIEGLPILLWSSLAVTALVGFVGLLVGKRLGPWLAGGFILSWFVSWLVVIVRSGLAE
jgi:xanthine/uracil permease